MKQLNIAITKINIINVFILQKLAIRLDNILRPKLL